MRLAAAAGALVLASCGHGGTARAPEGFPTLLPGAAIKDGLLHAAVKARLAGTDIDSATRVSVMVAGGVVTLRGTVARRSDKERDVNVVRAMRGVAGIHDELRVGHLGPSVVQTVRNASLVAAVTSALTAQAGINVTGIGVHADDGTVTLRGRAPTAAIRSTLVAAARHTPGVRNVIDAIAVK